MPPIERIEVNKNHLDLSTSKYAQRFRDDRSLWTRFKLRYSLEPNKQDFGALFDRHFGASNPLMNRVYPGELACSLAHIQIWQRLRDCNDDLCLVLEDDASLFPGMNANDFTWPRDAHLLHLYPHSLYNYISGDKYFNPMISRAPNNNQSNMKTIGYVITPEGARFLLDKLLPMPIDEPVDYAMFDQQPAGFRPYLSCRSMLSVVDYQSVVRHARGAKLLHALRTSPFAPVFRFVWRLFATRSIKRFVMEHTGR